MDEAPSGLSTRRDLDLPRQEREERRRISDILSAALGLIVEEGFGDFSMQRLAGASGYSRTALYAYFPCKEEVAIALAIESFRRRIQLYRMVPAFEGRPRERWVAMAEVSAILFPDLLNIELLAYTKAFRARTSEDRQRELHQLEMEGYGIAAEIVREAVECGDLGLPDGMTPEKFIFGNSMLVNGIFGAIATEGLIEELGVGDPIEAARWFGRHLLDGSGWRPLSHEWDYRKTMRRVYSELFTPVVIDRIKRV
jgi:AcrR family transcriptional regulator